MVNVERHLCTLRHARPRFAAVGPMPQCATIFIGSPSRAHVFLLPCSAGQKVGLVKTCRSHSLCLTHTAMDGFRPDAIVIDAPRSFHLPKLIVFLGVEGLLIATGVLAYSEPVPQLCSFCP
jgi:hypothetical protein